MTGAHWTDTTALLCKFCTLLTLQFTLYSILHISYYRKQLYWSTVPNFPIAAYSVPVLVHYSKHCWLGGKTVLVASREAENAEGGNTRNTAQYRLHSEHTTTPDGMQGPVETNTGEWGRQIKFSGQMQIYCRVYSAQQSSEHVYLTVL